VPAPEEGDGYPVGVLEVENGAGRNLDRPGVSDAVCIEMADPLAQLVEGSDRNSEVVKAGDRRVKRRGLHIS